MVGVTKLRVFRIGSMVVIHSCLEIKIELN